MPIGKKFQLLKMLSICLLGLFVIILGMAIFNQNALNRVQEIRYQSFLLANELMMTSDDLTRLARTYSVTADAKYETLYWDILNVRNGKKPRPDGQTISLRKLMEHLGFTESEFDKLKTAENNSNSLVTTETIAMNAIKGLYDDGTGHYTKAATADPEMARRIMHDDKYHQDKELIMVPIREFQKMLDSRTIAAVEERVTLGNVLLAALGLLVMAIILAFLFTMSSVNSVLKKIVGQLEESTTNSHQYSRSLVTTSQEFSSVSEQQASAIQETVSTLNEINAMVQKSLQNAEQSSEVARKSQSTAEKGKESVQQVLTSISEIGESNEMVVRQVEDGNKRLEEIILIIKEIGSKTKIINDIVFQTKLLSFNASVEAARAGEQGKGFAVVAQEVGSLAQMSGNASKEISDLLVRSIETVEGIIQETTKKIQIIVDQSRSKIERGTMVANTCDSELSEVVLIVKDVSSLMEGISKASDEQARGVNEITKAMHQLDNTTAQTSSMATQTAKSARDLNANNDRLKELVEEIEKTLLHSASHPKQKLG